MQVRTRVGGTEMRPDLICGKLRALNQYRPERERERREGGRGRREGERDYGSEPHSALPDTCRC